MGQEVSWDAECGTVRELEPGERIVPGQQDITSYSAIHVTVLPGMMEYYDSLKTEGKHFLVIDGWGKRLTLSPEEVMALLESRGVPMPKPGQQHG